jgi:hypothetical protein
MESMVACDFFTKTVLTARGPLTAYVLIFIHLGSRRVVCSAPTHAPDSAWVSIRIVAGTSGTTCFRSTFVPPAPARSTADASSAASFPPIRAMRRDLRSGSGSQRGHPDGCHTDGFLAMDHTAYRAHFGAEPVKTAADPVAQNLRQSLR